MLDVRTRGVPAADAGNQFVGRLKRNFLEQSYVGAILTNGNPASALSSSTVGVDLRLATSDFLGRGQNVVFNAFGLRSDNEGVADDNASFGFGAHYPNDRYEAQVLWREIQDNFDPAIGFVQRKQRADAPGRRQLQPRARTRRPAFSRCITTSSTRASRGSTTGWSRAGTSTPPWSTGTSTRATRCTACST